MVCKRQSCALHALASARIYLHIDQAGFSAGDDAAEARKLVHALSADYVWWQEPFQLQHQVHARCPWLETSLASERLLWAQTELDDGDQTDVWFIVWLLSCVTTSIEVRRGGYQQHDQMFASCNA